MAVFVIIVIFAVLAGLWLLACKPAVGTRPVAFQVSSPTVSATAPANPRAEISKAGVKGLLYAHRGLHNNEGEAPENTLAAFKKAVDAGYGIELDVQLTKDRVPVVIHDYTLKRVCGIDARVDSFTYEELQAFPIYQTDERVPKFADVLALVAGKVPLIVELKVEGTDLSVCPIADELLRAYQGVYCVESFNPLAVRWYRKNRPEVCRGQLSDCFIWEPDKALHGPLYFVLQNLLMNFLTKPDFVAFNRKYASSWNRRLCHEFYKNMAVAYTIKSQEQLDAAQKDFDIFIFDSFVPRNRVDSIIFDIDGTVWDTTPVVAEAYNAALDELNLTVERLTADRLRGLFGLPMDDIIRDILPDGTDETRAAFKPLCYEKEEAFLEEKPGAVYVGFEDTVRHLAKKFPLFVVSNCQSGYIELMLKKTGLAPYFKDFVCYGDNGNMKAENIKLMMERNGLKKPVYVGDTQMDADACKEAGVPIAYAAYGFGTVRDPDYTVQVPRDLLGLF